MRRILLATDGSEPARLAEDYIVKSYPEEDTTVIVVSVASVPDIVFQYAGAASHEEQMLGLEHDEIMENVQEDARKIAGEAVRRLREYGFEANDEVPLGDPGIEICRVAGEKAVDAIVMGRRGRGRIGELLLGSVSQYVVHHASCTVSIVPPAEESDSSA